jgi:hypothetical protein
LSWLLFAIFVWIAAALDVSLASLLSLGPSKGSSPIFTAIVVCYIGLFAPLRRTLWCSIAAGVVLDFLMLAPRSQTAPDELRLIGPHAIAMLLGVLVPLRLRTLVVRKNPLSLGLLSGLTVLTAYLALIMILSLRGTVRGDVQVSIGRGVIHALGSGVLTGVVGFVLAPILLRAAPSLGLRIGTVITSGSPRPRTSGR